MIKYANQDTKYKLGHLWLANRKIKLSTCTQASVIYTIPHMMSEFELQVLDEYTKLQSSADHHIYGSKIR